MKRITPYYQDQYLTVEDLACLLGVAPRTIYKWRYYGTGPKATKLPTGAVRYAVRDVQAWLNRGEEADDRA